MNKSTPRLLGIPLHRFRKLSKVHYDRAGRLGAIREWVDLAEILREYGLHCHICNQPIDYLDNAHFDHVIGFAEGGTHTADNIRLAHRRCNLVKELIRRGRVKA